MAAIEFDPPPEAPPIAALRLAHALALALLPGLAAALWVLPRRAGHAARLGAALGLSPALGGVLVTLLWSAGLPLPGATGAGFALAGMLAALGLWRERRPARRDSMQPDAAPDRSGATWGFTALVVVGVAAFPLFSEWWRVFSDSWSHADIVRALEQYGLPPVDPGFAGFHLQYPWIYHVFVAGLHRLTGADVFALLALLEAMALGGVTLAAGAAVARQDRAAAGWSLALLVFGLNALFPLFVPLELVRAFTGTVRGWAEVRRIFALWPLANETTGFFLRSLGGQTFFLDKFTVGTPFALSLACTAAWWAAFRRWSDRGHGRDLACGALLVLGAGLMHPVVGLDLGAVAGLTALAALVRRAPERPRGGTVRWALASLAGLVPVVLYTSTLVGGKGAANPGPPADLAPLKFVGYGTCLALGIVCAWRPLRRMARGDGADRAWAWAVLASALVAALVRLPGDAAFFTVDKFAYLVWIPLVLSGGPAFAAFLRRRSVGARVALAALLFVPVNGLALVSRVADPLARVRQEWDRPLYVWLRDHTPADAVLVTPAADWETAQFARRDQYFSLGHPAEQRGYPQAEIDARAALVDRLFATGRLDAADRARLLALHRPVYVVWTDFREPHWRTTPAAILRSAMRFGPRPEFGPELPLRFTAQGQEVHAVGAESIETGPPATPTGTIVPPDPTSARP